jgi:hypothetical protein
MCAYVLFQLYQGSTRLFLTSLGQLIFGSLLLFVLCAASLEFVGWGLLLLPVIFYIFLVVILVFNKGFQIQSKTVCKEDCEPEPEPETCEPEPETCDP